MLLRRYPLSRPETQPPDNPRVGAIATVPAIWQHPADGEEGGMAAADDEFVVGVMVFREEGRWQAALLPERLVSDLDALLAALRQQPAEGGSIGLVNVADEFFVALRVRGDDVSILVSDVTAAAAWDLARQVVSRLDIPIPDDDDMEDVLPGGDLSIFADLGMEEMELGAVLADTESYADEMLLAIAGRLGFGAAYQRALDGAMR